MRRLKGERDRKAEGNSSGPTSPSPKEPKDASVAMIHWGSALGLQMGLAFLLVPSIQDEVGKSVRDTDP